MLLSALWDSVLCCSGSPSWLGPVPLAHPPPLAPGVVPGMGDMRAM